MCFRCARKEANLLTPKTTPFIFFYFFLSHIIKTMRFNQTVLLIKIYTAYHLFSIHIQQDNIKGLYRLRKLENCFGTLPLFLQVRELDNSEQVKHFKYWKMG